MIFVHSYKCLLIVLLLIDIYCLFTIIELYGQHIAQCTRMIQYIVEVINWLIKSKQVQELHELLQRYLPITVTVKNQKA